MRPLIGITAAQDWRDNKHFLRDNYWRAIEACGGIPVILPSYRNLEDIEEICKQLQGILLSGGEDVDSAFYAEEPKPGMGAITPERDMAEIELTRMALTRDIPLLAICRGIQVLAAAVGGTLWQDISTQVQGICKHSQEAPRWYPTHKVKIEKSKLSRIVNSKEIRVNSFHHQAVKKIPEPFVITARSGDGVIEAVESRAHKFVLGVQWHPEAMWRKFPDAKGLFDAFVEAASRHDKTF